MPIRTAHEYVQSLRNRKLKVWLFGELVPEPVDHPVIRPSINAVAETYRIAEEDPALGSAVSPLTGQPVNRFLHVTGSADDVVAQNKLQRRLGQRTGTCFQRCVGMDAINSLWSLTWDVDKATGSGYHARFQSFVKQMQAENFVIGGAMTDPKGDRSLQPHQQHDPDLFVRVVERRDGGVVIRGAKAHQTGCINSHWLLVMPTMRLTPEDKAWCIAGAVPVDHPRITYIYGRQSCDTRAMEGNDVDQGNARFGGQEALIVFDDVFIPDTHVFLDGETQYAASLVERFTSYHRRSYVCKTGLGDVIIGAAATIADYNGVPKASHIRDKLVEMAHLNETIYGAGIASSHESKPTPAGNWQCDDLLANVCKHNVTRFPYELARLAQDLAGGLLATLPADAEFESAITGPILRKYLATRPGVSVDNRRRILRLIENLTMGRNAVGYLTESMHGAGSPQAQRVQIQRLMNLEEKKGLAKKLAGVVDEKR